MELNHRIINPNLEKHSIKELNKMIKAIDLEINSFPESKNYYLKSLKSYIKNIILIKQNHKLEV